MEQDKLYRTIMSAAALVLLALYFFGIVNEVTLLYVLGVCWVYMTVRQALKYIKVEIQLWRSFRDCLDVQ